MSDEAFSLRFVVPGDPVTKLRHRTGRYGGTYTPRKTVQYEELVAWSARKAMQEAGIEPLNSDARFTLHVDFYLGDFWPTDDPKKRRRVRIDGSNAFKAVEDGLTPHKPRGREKPPGLFWKDDEQVIVGIFSKALAATMKCEPHAVVVVKML